MFLGKNRDCYWNSAILYLNNFRQVVDFTMVYIGELHMCLLDFSTDCLRLRCLAVTVDVSEVGSSRTSSMVRGK